jgi:hypothetical protein
MKVVISLAEMNRPMTVSEIKTVGPKLTPFSTGNEKQFNKPGLTSGCHRLLDLGILEVATGMTGWQANRTHYRIRPTLETLSKIDEQLGSSVLSMIRQGAFGKAVISSDLHQYLLRRLIDPIILTERRRRGEPDPPLDEIDLLDIEFIAKMSTMALEVLIDPVCISYEISETKGALLDLALRVRRLREVMMLALLFDLGRSHPSKLMSEGISLVSSDDIIVTIGTEMHHLKSSFDSKNFLTRLNAGAREAGADKSSGASAHATKKERGIHTNRMRANGKEK